MTSDKTIKAFKQKYYSKDKVSTKKLMKDLGISRPTATNLIATMLTRRAIIPIFKLGDKNKWYQLK